MHMIIIPPAKYKFKIVCANVIEIGLFLGLKYLKFSKIGIRVVELHLFQQYNYFNNMSYK
jgi:hypothetical protein